MSPEQAKGATVDRRTDIWAFGCVLFEMLTGRMCFHGDSTAETIVRVLDREPEWERLPPSTPDHVRRVLGRCLQKDVNRRLRDLGDARLDLEDAEVAPWNRQQPPISVSRRGWWLTLVAAGLVAAIVGGLWRAGGRSPLPPRETRVTRLTDLPGLEETPALSPDGKALAFTAAVDNQRQILVQLLAGGAPLRLTQDPVDHEAPRWTADSSTIVYFSPAAPGSAQGALWEISALGGSAASRQRQPRGRRRQRGGWTARVLPAGNGSIALVTATPDGASVTPVAEFPPSSYYLNPRWSPDGRWIAFERGDSIRFDVFAVACGGGPVRQVTRENNMINGFAWLPDSKGIVYSSSRASTMPYLGTSSLWSCGLDDGAVRQLSSGDLSYVNPDVSKDGAIVVGRLRLQSDIWKFPIEGTPAENVARGLRVTRQTGEVLTPTASPDDREVAFLSDSGGHANLWVVDVASGRLRQITNERDPAVAVGVPVWSPDGKAIAFVYSKGNRGLTFGVWLVNPDGSNLRNLANPGLGPAWSRDGASVYYSTRGDAASDVVLRKIPATVERPATITTERLRNVIGSDGTVAGPRLRASARRRHAGVRDSRRDARDWPVPRAHADFAVARPPVADREPGAVTRRQVAGAGADRRLRRRTSGPCRRRPQNGVR